MLRLEYATVSLVRSCARNTAGMPKSNNNNGTNARTLLLVRHFKNGIVYLRHLQRETKAIKNFLSRARQGIRLEETISWNLWHSELNFDRGERNRILDRPSIRFKL